MCFNITLAMLLLMLLPPFHPLLLPLVKNGLQVGAPLQPPPFPEPLVGGNLLTQPGAGDEKPSTPQRSNKTFRALEDSFTPFVSSPSNRRRTLQYPLGNGMHVLCCFFPPDDACSPVLFLLPKFQEMMHRCWCLSRIYLPFLRDHGLVWEEGVDWNGP